MSLQGADRTDFIGRHAWHWATPGKIAYEIQAKGDQPKNTEVRLRASAQCGGDDLAKAFVSEMILPIRLSSPALQSVVKLGATLAMT